MSVVVGKGVIIIDPNSTLEGVRWDARRWLKLKARVWDKLRFWRW